MKTIFFTILLLTSTLSFAFDLPTKCSQESSHLKILLEDIKIINQSFIFPKKVVNKTAFLEAEISYQMAKKNHKFLLSQIEKSLRTSELKYDFVERISDLNFRSKSSCIELSKIRFHLKRYSKVSLPEIDKSKLKKEITIAVIDTGIDLNNEALTKRMVIPSTLSELDFSGLGLQDLHGHGSHVTGLILAAFPYAKILPLNYFNPNFNGQQNLDATVKALNYAIDQKVDIINYSGGGPEASYGELKALKKAEKMGIIIVSAAGNERSNIDLNSQKYFPASYELSNSIVVGNIDNSQRRSPSSNFGKKSIDIFAFGTRSLSFGLSPNCSQLMTGTSQSTPLVTGALALAMALNPKLTPFEARQLVLEQASIVKRLEHVSKFGAVLDFSKLAKK